MSDYDRSIHSNPDARAWARFFEETRQKNGWPSIPDEATMLGWFANAMMAMHDHLKRAGGAAPDAGVAPRATCDVCAKTFDSEDAYVECPGCFRPPPEPAPDANAPRPDPVSLLEAERDCARFERNAWQRACEKAEAALADSRSYVPQKLAKELIDMLEASGLGTPGNPNTLWAMTKEAAEAVKRAAPPRSEAPPDGPGAEARNVEARFLLEAVSRALDGQDPGDFASSFPVVAEAMGMASRCSSAECARDDHRASLVQYEKDWRLLLILIAEVSGEEDPEAAVADEFDPWEALRRMKAAGPRSEAGRETPERSIGGKDGGVRWDGAIKPTPPGTDSDEGGFEGAEKPWGKLPDIDPDPNAPMCGVVNGRIICCRSRGHAGNHATPFPSQRRHGPVWVYWGGPPLGPFGSCHENDPATHLYCGLEKGHEGDHLSPSNQGSGATLAEWPAGRSTSGTDAAPCGGAECWRTPDGKTWVHAGPRAPCDVYPGPSPSAPATTPPVGTPCRYCAGWVGHPNLDEACIRDPFRCVGTPGYTGDAPPGRETPPSTHTTSKDGDR